MPFDYNGSNGPNFLTAFGYHEPDDNLKILYGSWYFHRNPGTMNHSEQVSGIYSFPARLNSGLVIRGIDADGTISASCDNETIVLRPGDKWQSPVTGRAENESFMLIVNGSWSDVYAPFTVYYNTTWTVENMGISDKSLLKR